MADRQDRRQINQTALKSQKSALPDSHSQWGTKATTQKTLAHKNGYRTTTEVALAALICAGLQGSCFVWWEYISTGRWWATLMRHDLLARPPLTLAPGMCMTAFAAVLVALSSSTLGTTSG